MREKAIRIFVVLGLSCLIGLIGGRILSLGKNEIGFAWPGFFAGSGLVLLAYLISRPLVAWGEQSASQGTQIQRALMRVATLAFLGALVSFATFIYTSWTWLRIPLYLTMIVGAVSVFAGIVLVWIGPASDQANR